MRRNPTEAPRLATRPPVLLTGLVIGILFFAAGCDDPDAIGGAPGLRVTRFNSADLDRVPLNAVLVFTFNQAVSPDTVNSDTIRIERVDGDRRELAAGTFVVQGPTVSWFPRMTSQAYPVREFENDNAVLLPDDAGLNTRGRAGGERYRVVVASLPSPHTVRSVSGNRPVIEAYRATFQTVAVDGPVRDPQAVARLFNPDAPYFRDSLRIADVLAYESSASGEGFSAWLRDPTVTAGENPLYHNPALLATARDEWQGRKRSGEWIDQVLGIQLLPRLTGDDLADNAFPPGVALRDERLVSNLHGARQGRGRPVTGLHVYFTQPLVPNRFVLPDAGQPAPVQVRVLASPGDDPAALAAETATISFLNDPDLHASLVSVTLQKPVRKGWIHLTIDPGAARGMAGARLESCGNGPFVYLWPVEIRAD